MLRPWVLVPHKSLTDVVKYAKRHNLLLLQQKDYAQICKDSIWVNWWQNGSKLYCRPMDPKHGRALVSLGSCGQFCCEVCGSVRLESKMRIVRVGTGPQDYFEYTVCVSCLGHDCLLEVQRNNELPYIRILQ